MPQKKRNLTLLNDKPCTYLGRIAGDDTAYQKLDLDLDAAEIAWTIRGFGPQFHHVSFELSSDGVSFTPIGDVVFTRPDSWVLCDESVLSFKGNAFIRAIGFTSSGAGNGSVSITESILNVYYPEYLIYLPMKIK